jgi:hypothetical protein
MRRFVVALFVKTAAIRELFALSRSVPAAAALTTVCTVVRTATGVPV